MSLDGLPLVHRQLDQETGAALFAVSTADFSAMLLNDSVAHAQSQPGALSHRAGSVKGIENPAWVLHSWPVVGKLDVDARSDSAGGNRQLAAVLLFHGIRGIV